MKQKGVVRTSLKNTSASVESLGTQNKIELDHLRNHLVGNQNIVPSNIWRTNHKPTLLPFLQNPLQNSHIIRSCSKHFSFCRFWILAV